VIVVAVALTWLMITLIDPVYERLMSRMGRSYRLAIVTSDDHDTQEAINLIHRTIDAKIHHFDYEHIPETIVNYDTVLLL
jgi:hypothetical protein